MSTQKYFPILWLWLAALLLSTVGISVQQVYCYCADKTSISLFGEAKDACANTAADAETCCKKQALPECCSPQVSDSGTAGCCTKTAATFFRLDAKYTVEQSVLKKFDCPFWAEEQPAFLSLYSPVICDAGVLNKAPSQLPPSLSGRDICLRHEIFRL
ncbi:MAG: hypothetical protein KDD14_25640 [Saprospiraceae bacterium]|nr:hypothetical protein [Saprospiraceae bacterium]